MIQAYALSVCVVVLTLYFLGFETARVRAKRKIVLNQEDTLVTAGASVGEVEHVDVQRLLRAHRNALENAVPFFVLGLLYLLTGPGATFARVLFGVFAVVRVLHAAFYLQARQPYRTGMFAVGALVNMIMLVQVLRAVFAAM
ncbi:MAG: MAPEG family protein [Kofleriaceae bacterium]